MRQKLLFLAALFTLSACSIARPVHTIPYHPATAPTPDWQTEANAASDVIAVRSAAPAPLAFDARLTTYAYPFAVHFFRLRSQGSTMQMAYMDEKGTSSNGKTVLLLHGKNFSSSYWQPTIKALVENGYRVIAVDQIGFGKSSKPARYQYSFATLADNTRRLLNALQIDRAIVIGHSMGGMLAARFAISYPALTEKLVLVNPLGLEDWQKHVPYQPLETTYSNELSQNTSGLREYMRANYFSGNWKPEYEDLLTIHEGWKQGPDARLIAWNSALASDMIFTQPVVQDFPQIEAPTLLLIGQLDRTAIGKDRVPADTAAKLGNYPELGRQAAKRIPNARLAALPRAGHLPMVDSFEAYIREIERFLAE